MAPFCVPFTRQITSTVSVKIRRTSDSRRSICKNISVLGRKDIWRRVCLSSIHLDKSFSDDYRPTIDKRQQTIVPRSVDYPLIVLCRPTDVDAHIGRFFNDTALFSTHLALIAYSRFCSVNLCSQGGKRWKRGLSRENCASVAHLWLVMQRLFRCVTCNANFEYLDLLNLLLYF